MSENVYDLAVSGDVVMEDVVVENGTVLVKGEHVAAVCTGSEPFEAKQHLGGPGKLILPGVIDSHVHSLSYPGEGFIHSTRSAAAGGVTTLIDMPVDAPRGIATVPDLEEKRRRVEQESYIDVALLGSVKNESLDHIPGLAEAGVCGFKLSLFDTDPDRFPRVRDGQLLDAFSLIRETGLSAGIHAENDEIIKRLIQKYQSEGKTSPIYHCITRPEVSETESVLKGLEIARAAGVHLHLYHLSCSRSVELARRYREEGSSVTVETCPHYLVFTEDDMDRLGARIRINPPMRSQENVRGLWAYLEQGLIDCVSSDHAPWPLARKSEASIFDNACGAPGVETLLPIMFTEAVVKRRLSIVSLVQLLSVNPARVFGLHPKKGNLCKGADADLVVLDPRKKWVVRGEKSHTSAEWTPYEDFEITGLVEATVVRGRIVAKGGEVVGEADYGRFVRPIQERTGYG
jgi:allantoinase